VANVERICTASEATFDSTAMHYEASHPIHLMGKEPAPIGIREYITRLVYYMGTKAEDLACAMSYLRRLVESVPIGPRSVHRAVAAAFACAHTSRHEACYGIQYIARVSGVPVVEMLRIETCMRLILRYNLSPSAEVVASTLEEWGVDCTQAKRST
jgi:transcription initiation factor TFIIIB Brf1 subunit/transcription initiation factor TFIIB